MSSYIHVSKKSKCQDNDDRDLISKLPQSVICHILSRLPSKDAVQTSILSKDWVFKWISSYNVDIDDAGAIGKKKTKFMNFVNKMLRPSHDLKSVRFLFGYKHSTPCLKASITTALRRNTESFEILFPLGFELPRGFIDNTSLRNLKLMPSPRSRYSKPTSHCTFRVTNDNCFPNLTCLYLNHVEILNESTDSDRIVFTLPVLRTLELLYCKFSKLMEIYSPALTTFKSMTAWDRVHNGYTIKIHGAHLAKFESSGGFRNIILIDSVVRSGSIMMHGWDCDPLIGLQALKLMEGFSGIVDLELSPHICGSIALSKQKLPRYDQLRRLVIGDRDLNLLLELLHSAPSLKFLETQHESHVEQNQAQNHDFEVVGPVPLCVLFHLEEVKIKCCYTKTYEKPVAIAKFLLKNGMMMKKLRLYVKGGYFSSNKVVEQLFLCPRASPSVEILAC